jgi:hypothetical protein
MSQSRDPATISAATYPSYDAGGMGVTTAWKSVIGKAKLGAGMSIAAVAVAISAELSLIFLVLLALVSAGGLGWLFWSKMESERMIVLARHDVVPEVDRVFVEGRY